MTSKREAWERSFICASCGTRCSRKAGYRDDGECICNKCHIRDLSTPTAMCKKQIILEAIHSIEPNLTDDEIIHAVEDATDNLGGLGVIVNQLRTDPNLFSGSSMATPLAYRLITLLQEAGAENIALPRCALCREAKPLPKKLRGSQNQRICGACYQREYHVEKCSSCGRKRTVNTRTRDGEPICAACRRRDPGNWEDCAFCGEFYRINSRTGDGRAICKRCYQPPEDLCDFCGGYNAIASRKYGETICFRCYRSPKRRCNNCGRIRRIRCEASEYTPEMCSACFEEPVVICSRCGREDRCTGIRTKCFICHRCRLSDRLDGVLTGSDGEIPEALLAVKERILSMDPPYPGHIWVQKSEAVDVLRRIARGELELSHEALDELPPRRYLVYLRDLLMDCGALPERNQYLQRLTERGYRVRWRYG